MVGLIHPIPHIVGYRCGLAAEGICPSRALPALEVASIMAVENLPSVVDLAITLWWTNIAMENGYL